VLESGAGPIVAYGVPVNYSYLGSFRSGGERERRLVSNWKRWKVWRSCETEVQQRCKASGGSLPLACHLRLSTVVLTNADDTDSVWRLIRLISPLTYLDHNNFSAYGLFLVKTWINSYEADRLVMLGMLPKQFYHRITLD